MKKILTLTLSLIFLLTLFSLNVLAQEPSNYVIVEVFDVYSGNCSLIDELELFDGSGVKIDYTTSSTEVYDTKSTNGIPGYWNSTGGWGRVNLNDGEKLGATDSATIVNYITDPGAGNWTRFVVTLPANTTISKVNVWTNSTRIPKKVTLYSANSYDFNLNIKGRDNTGLTLLAEINPASTATGSTLNEAILFEPEIPSMPTNLTATAGIEKVDLNWDAVTTATGYNVKRATVAGGPYTTIATNINTTTYPDLTATSGTTYYYVVTAINAQGESVNSNEVAVTPLTNSESVSVETTTDTVNIGTTFTTDIVLHGGTNICAEDFKVTYNTELFEYVGYEAVPGLTVYKEISHSATGTVRMIVASLGKDNAINGDKTLVKLKFKAKKAGKDKIDVVKCRIADNGTFEKDILETNCGEKEITVKANSDVNRTGEFTLLDLAIDAWYYGMPAADTDTTKYDADVVLNGTVDNADLTAIVAEILNNTNYQPNN